LRGAQRRSNLGRTGGLLHPDLTVDDVLEPEFRDRERDPRLEHGALRELTLGELWAALCKSAADSAMVLVMASVAGIFTWLLANLGVGKALARRCQTRSPFRHWSACLLHCQEGLPSSDAIQELEPISICLMRRSGPSKSKHSAIQLFVRRWPPMESTSGRLPTSKEVAASSPD